MVLGAAAVLWMLSSQGMLLIIAGVCAWRMFTRDWQQQADSTGLMQFAGCFRP